MPEYVYHVEGWYLPRPFTHTAETVRFVNVHHEVGDVEQPTVQATRIVLYGRSDARMTRGFKPLDCGRVHFTLRILWRGRRPQFVGIWASSVKTNDGELNNIGEDLHAVGFPTRDAANAWQFERSAAGHAAYVFAWDDLEFVRG